MDKLIELHIKSTLGELNLFDAFIEAGSNVQIVRKILDNAQSLPGVIVGNRDGQLSLLSRKIFFENMSKPYCLELYSKRSVSFLLESIDYQETLILPSTMLITTAVQKCLEREKMNFDEPIIVEFENGACKLLDSYHLMLAHSKINQLVLKALKEADELKTDLLSIAAHDLKNPLHTIINLIKMVKTEFHNFSPEAVEYWSQINETAEHMLNLIVELLNSTVIESGNFKLKMQMFDISELVFAIIYLNKTYAESKLQTLNFILDKNETYFVEGDSLKIREAIENLVSNAIKYSPLESTIEVKLEINDSIIALSVKDEGPGLSEDDKSKLFGKFQRLSALPTGGESSTGLGLFIAKQIVELHEGKILVKSDPGMGSEFIIELPAAEIPD